MCNLQRVRVANDTPIIFLGSNALNAVVSVQANNNQLQKIEARRDPRGHKSYNADDRRSLLKQHNLLFTWNLTIQNFKFLSCHSFSQIIHFLYYSFYHSSIVPTTLLQTNNRTTPWKIQRQ